MGMKFGLALLTIFMGTSPVRADFMAGATGHATMDCPGALKKCGVIHFAVLDRVNGHYGDTWATGFKYFDHAFERGVAGPHDASPRLDFGAKYLYVYQITNDSTALPLQAAQIPFYHPSHKIVSSWGYFSGLGFGDDKKMTGKSDAVSATNKFGLVESGAGPHLKVINPAVVPITEGNDSGLNPYEVLLTEKSLRPSWLGGKVVTPGRRSTLFGFTSAHPPTFIKGYLIIKCGHEGEPVCPRE